MKIRHFDTEYGTLQYKACEDHVVISEYRGRDITLTIPVNIEGLPVTVIGKKAFLSAGGLKKIVLPKYMRAIQDWAFASCRGLKTVILPKENIEAGQGIFKDCDNLDRIIPVTAYADNEFEFDPDSAAVSHLLAAVMNKLDAFYLFTPKSAGDVSWLEQWDARMMFLIGQADDEGFSRMLLCGEEDYGSRENNLEYYMEQRRRFKVRLAMLRIMYDTGLKDDIKNTLIDYLKSHTKGSASEETWKVVLEEHGDEREFYQLLLDYDCINSKNITGVLEDMGDRHTEVKAFLMNRMSAADEDEEVFNGLEFEL